MSGRWRRAAAFAMAGGLLGPAALPGAAGETPAAAAGDPIVAEVGDRAIVASELREAVIERRRRELAAGRLTTAHGPAGWRETLDALLDVRRLALEARRLELEARPELRRRIEARVDAALAAVLVEAEVEGRATEAALRAFYAAHPEEFRTPRRVQARHVVVRERALAEALHREIAAGAALATLAREHNADSTRESGGELGWVSPGVMVRGFEEALFALGPGELSPVVETPYGFHVIRAEAVEGGERIPFEEARESVRQRFVEARLAELQQEVRRRYPASVREGVLAELAR